MNSQKAHPSPGDRVPDAVFKRLGPNGVEDLTSTDLFGGKRVLAVGVVGAFTPVCTQRHLPEFIPYQAQLLEADVIDKVVCISVADPFVLHAWKQTLEGAEDLEMLTDTNAAFADSMGLAVDLSHIGFGTRSTRYALLVDDGVIRILRVEQKPNEIDVTSGSALAELIMSQ